MDNQVINGLVASKSTLIRKKPLNPFSNRSSISITAPIFSPRQWAFFLVHKCAWEFCGLYPINRPIDLDVIKRLESWLRFYREGVSFDKLWVSVKDPSGHSFITDFNGIHIGFGSKHLDNPKLVPCIPQNIFHHILIGFLVCNQSSSQLDSALRTFFKIKAVLETDGHALDFFVTKWYGCNTLLLKEA